MIRYALKCDQGHGFESWFQSSGAFEALDARGLVSCAVCGSTEVHKAIMAPRVVTDKDAAPAKGPAPAATPAPQPRAAPAPGQAAPAPSLSAPATPAEQALKAMRDHLEKSSTYVGGKFAEEARRIHLGDAPQRTIHGEANPEEARALIEDGIPVAPLPFVPKSRSN